MASKTYYFSGIAKWAMLKSVDPEYKNYKIVLYPDDSSWEKFAEAKLQLVPKEDADGKYINLRRPETKDIKGKIVNFGPPEVIDANGKPVDQLVGNGSTVTCKVTVYDTRRGKGHRLEAVRVDNLIPYEKKDTDSSSDSFSTPASKNGEMPF
jgi:hypothetical protein